MKLTNRILTLGLGLGLVAISGTAFAHSGQEKVAARRDFSQYDQSGDHRVSLGELEAHALRKSATEFARFDLDSNRILNAYEQSLARQDGCALLTDQPAWERYDRSGYRPNVRVLDRRSRYDRYPTYPVYRENVMTLARFRQLAVNEARETFFQADVNRDGFLSKAELVRVQELEQRGADSNWPRHRA